MRRLKYLMLLGFLAILGVAGCSKLKKEIICDEWSGQEGAAMGSAWKACKDGKSYQLACAAGTTGFNCNCIVDGASVKTSSTATPFQGDRAYWTDVANVACGWSLSPK